jgi:hypothetical protein
VVEKIGAMARKDTHTAIQENDFAFSRAAHWRLRAGNGYKRLNHSDADVVPAREGSDSQQSDEMRPRLALRLSRQRRPGCP